MASSVPIDNRTAQAPTPAKTNTFSCPKQPPTRSETPELPSLCSPSGGPSSTADQLGGDEGTASHSFFLFVNPASGGNGAAAFTEAGLQHIELSIPEPVCIRIWDIRQGPTGNKPGFVLLRSLLRGRKDEQQNPKTKTDPVYVIAAGGDGTVMWVVSELWAHNISEADVALGVVPYGTGNDFARAFGWQRFAAAKPYDHNFKVLRELVREWLLARIVWHDIWEVVVTINNNGSFLKIDSKSRLKRMVTGMEPLPRSPLQSAFTDVSTEKPNPNSDIRVLHLSMCNYFSMGVESRIGIGFERYRTKNPFCNKMRYLIEGTKKAFFKKPVRMEALIAECVIPPSSSSNTTTSDTNGTATSEPTVIFSRAQDSKRRLKSAGSIIASNIPSFAAGLDLWSASQRIGVTGSSSNPTSKAELKGARQKLGDGLLEVISFRGIADMGLERAIKGRGKRIAQARGPFIFTFVREEHPKAKSRQQRVYFQVDGEFFIMTEPKTVSIQWKRHIRVLASASSPLVSNAFLDADS